VYLDLNLRLTDAQEALKEEVHRFAQEVLRPAGQEIDRLDPAEALREGSLWWDCKKKMREMGFHLTFIPEDLGGSGLGPIEHHIIWEELGWGSVGLALSQDVDVYPAAWLVRMSPGNQRLIEDLVKPYVRDTEARIIGCWGITEPDHGSDTLMAGTPQFRDPAISHTVRARQDGDTWVITGQKSAWISNGPVATHALLFVGIDSSKGMAGGGIAVVPLDLPGVSKGPVLRKLGQLDLPQGELFFHNVRIPKEYMLVGPDRYEFWVQQVLSVANCGMASLFTGVARAAFEFALTYAKDRVQGGKRICEHQLIQKKLFDMFVRVETARAYSRAAVEYCFTAIPAPIEYAVGAKVYCTEVAFQNAHEAVQIYGGYGLSREFPVEKLLRDARAALIEDGCSEVLSLIGASGLLRSYIP
jgi:alkylation response protein AidB-like acyl-CoA dehydrogenase